MKITKLSKTPKGVFVCTIAWMLQILSVLLSFLPVIEITEVTKTQYTLLQISKNQDNLGIPIGFLYVVWFLFVITISIGTIVFLSQRHIIPVWRIPHTIVFIFLSGFSIAQMMVNVFTQSVEDYVSIGISFAGWIYLIITTAALLMGLLLTTILEALAGSEPQPAPEAVSSKPKETGVYEYLNIASDQDLTCYMKRARLFVEMGEYSKALYYCESILNVNPELAEVYIIEMMAELQVNNYDELPNYYMFFEDTASYRYVLRFADKEQIDYLHSRKEN